MTTATDLLLGGQAERMAALVPPRIYLQRLAIHLVPAGPVTDEAGYMYLTGLCALLEMTDLSGPVLHRSRRYGLAAWMHWETSGVHLYAWDGPDLFLAVDIVTCKRFNSFAAVRFTGDYFGAAPDQIAHLSV